MLNNESSDEPYEKEFISNFSALISCDSEMTEEERDFLIRLLVDYAEG